MIIQIEQAPLVEIEIPGQVAFPRIASAAQSVFTPAGDLIDDNVQDALVSLDAAKARLGYRGQIDLGFGAIDSPSTSGDATTALQARVAALKASGALLSPFKIVGRQETTETLVFDSINGTTANRISVFSDGQGAGMLVNRHNPSRSVLEFSGTGSWSLMIFGFRIGDRYSTNNTDAAAIRFTDGFVAVDTQIFNMFLSGTPRGIQGSMVGVLLLNIVFDYMPDYGIICRNKDFRKVLGSVLEFYRCKDACVYLDGSMQNDGITPTTQTHRDNSVGSGYFALSAFLCDRSDNADGVQQKMFNLKAVDRDAVSAGVWNGASPLVVTEGIPYDFVSRVDCHGFSWSGHTFYTAHRGLYFEDCNDWSLSGFTLIKANLDGFGFDGGAITIKGGKGFYLNGSIADAGGTGIWIQGAQDSTIDLAISRAQLCGAYFSRLKNCHVRLTIRDCNMADSILNPDVSGAIFTGVPGDFSENNTIEIIAASSDPALYQRYHLNMSQYSRNNTILGSVGLGRTGYAQVRDDGLNNRYDLKGLANTRTVIATDAAAAKIVRPWDKVILCDASVAPMTLVLPPASYYADPALKIVKIDASANGVFVNPDGLETLNGALLPSITAQYSALKPASDGVSAWYSA